MSIIPPDIKVDLQFYLSGPLPCPYLPFEVERKLFTRLSPNHPADHTTVNAALCRAGFRRSHDVIYRPACSTCNACIPVRIATEFFVPSPSLRRVQTRHQDLTWHCTSPQPTDELFALFSSYQQCRHSDSDMARMTEVDFSAMLQEGQVNTHLYQLRDQNRNLQGCIIADHVGDGLSAVYSFFMPNQPRRSLGTALILGLIAEAQKNYLPFVYLGYWVAGSRKMSYKTRFMPLQFLGAGGWDWLELSTKGEEP